MCESTLKTVDKNSKQVLRMENVDCSIFELDHFPMIRDAKGVYNQALQCTPLQWKTACDAWKYEGIDVNEACKLAGISAQQFYGGVENYTELSQYHEAARKIRAHTAVAKAQREAANRTYDVHVDPVTGKTMPNMAAVRRSELICTSLHWQAEKLNPAVYGRKEQIEQRNLNVNVNANVDISSLNDVLGLDISKLCGVHEGTRK